VDISRLRIPSFLILDDKIDHQKGNQTEEEDCDDENIKENPVDDFPG
jgi:hypothetical protein